MSATLSREGQPNPNRVASHAKPVAEVKPARTPKNFRAHFCERFACPADQYEQQLFAHSLHRHAVPFARILAGLSPEFFREDLGFICDLASATSRSEVLTELNRFYGRNVRDQNWLRRTFSLRVSGKRVQRLARRLFSAADGSTG
jgi:hypothetical protein